MRKGRQKKHTQSTVEAVAKQELAAAKDKPRMDSKIVFQGQNHPKKMRKLVVLEQWVEIQVENGKTVTRLYPSNEKLIEQGQSMLPPPELVYRRLNFVHGVPEEYLWAMPPDEQTRRYGGGGIQRMTTDRWLEVIEWEQASGTGHIGPCRGNLPRPNERGGCDCPTCSYNRKILEGPAGGQ